MKNLFSKNYWAMKGLAVVVLVVMGGSVRGQILQWNTYGNVGTETSEPSVYNDPNISSANLTQGSITAASNGNRFGGSGWFNTGNTALGNTLSEAISGNDYIQFVVTPNSGYSFTATSFVFNWDKSGTGPVSVTLRSSNDNYTNNLGTVASTAAVASSNTILISNLTNITSATTFRLYGYGSTATTGTGGFDCTTSIVNVQLNGSVASVGGPNITQTGLLNTFISSAVSSPSSEQTFTVAGTTLTDNIVITPPTGYQVSTTSGSGFGSSVTLTQSSGTVATTTIYARFNPTALINQVGGNITITSTGATTQNVAVSGEVTNLSAGAIAIVAFQGATLDLYRIVALEEIPNNTRIWFTDKSWDGNGGTLAFTTGEGNNVWTNTTGSAIAAGTVIQFDAAGAATLGTGGLSGGLGSAGEQLFAYQGTITSPTFVAGYTSGTVITTGVPTSTETWVPAGLTSGTNFVALGGTTFGSSYVTAATHNRILSDLRSHIHNTTNLTTGSTSITTNGSWPTYTFNIIAVQEAGILLLENNFSITNAALTSNSWTQIGSTTTNPISTGSGNGLSFSTYGSTNLGNAAIMANNGQDVYRTFTSQNPGAGTSTVYYSALVSVSSIQNTGDYFLSLGESSTFSGSSTLRARVYAKQGSSSSKVLFGISTNGTVVYTTTEYNINTTILLAIKHSFTTTTSTSSLFINPSTTFEPIAANVTDATASTVGTGLNAIVLNQGEALDAATLVIDGIRIATNWGALMGNPQYTSSSNIVAGNYNSINLLSGTLTATGNINIYNGSVTVESGTTFATANQLSLKSDANGTASIGNSAGTITGNITVERYIPALRKFRFLAAPVVGATAANWRNNGTNTTGIGTQITGNGGATNNFDVSTTNAASAFSYNELLAGSDVTVGSGATSDPGWTAFTDGNTEALTNGKGFRILVRGDRTISLDGTGSVTPTNTTLSVSGTYPSASVSIATTKTNSNTNSGFNLVGNPYPATIDWNTVTKGADISSTYTTYNPNTGAFVAWNGTTGDASRYIASAQAFFVQQTGTTGGITIAEANKATNAAGNYFRNKLTDHLKISMIYDSANYDAAFIHFRADAQNDFDNYDGLKFQNAGVNIASVGTDGKRYNINSLASLSQTTEMPISILGSVLANYELKFEDVQSFKNHELYLIDTYLNKMLLLSEGFSYPIALSSDSASVKDGRLKIVFVQKTTGINPNEKNANAFLLYPNPAADAIHLLLDAKNTNIENVAFEICNQLGAIIQFGNLDFTNAKDQSINIETLAQGIYFIKLQSNAQQQIIKFIK